MFSANLVAINYSGLDARNPQTFENILNQFLMGSEYPERGYYLQHKIIVLTITFILSLIIVNVRSKNNERCSYLIEPGIMRS